MALPACDASTVQVPALTSVTLVPVTVHVAGVVDAKATGRLDDDVALTGTGPVPKVLPGSEANVMVWLAAVTENCWLTVGAAP